MTCRNSHANDMKRNFHGFNLLGMFCRTKMENGDRRIFGHFPEDHFQWMREWGFNFARPDVISYTGDKDRFGYPIADEADFIGDDGKVRWSPNPTAEVYVEPEDWDSPFQLF